MDWVEAMAIEPLNFQKDKFVQDQGFTLFQEKINNKTLENYVYLVPRQNYNDPGFPYPNTQHPAEDVRSGELLIKQVYGALRNSDYWDQTLLIITYDEHGGFWDSIPPTQSVKNPDPSNEGMPYKFDYTRLGPRVPAIIISPWV